jgi:hypothetical protein
MHLNRDELNELHYITPITNVPSIMANGILSYELAQKMAHESCASNEVQERRANVVIPGGGKLHEYANVYINGRNPMMFKLRDKHHDLVILSVSANIVDLPGAIVTDRNAARGYAIFKPALNGLKMIDSAAVFAEYWTHEDEFEQDRHKGAMCAEVLIRYKIEPRHIVKAYVSCIQAEQSLKAALDQAGLDLSIEIAPKLFFQ